MESCKVIDLFQRIAKGEEIPKSIKYNSYYWNWDYCYRTYKRIDEDGDTMTLYNYLSYYGDLNDEVEFTGEEKEIKELSLDEYYLSEAQQEVIVDTINKLIREVKELKNK